MSANLVLLWHLDSITPDNTVIDTTENHLNARLEGNPQSTPDEKFGSCVVFDGKADAFILEDSPPIRLQTYTVELWINPNKPSTWMGVIGKPGRNYCMYLHPDGYVHHRFATPANTNDGFNTPSGSISWKVWQHVAITNDGQTARTYIDGNLAGEYSFTGGLTVSQKPLIVGRDLDGVTKQFYFGGRMAHVRLYDAPLSALEIQRDMAEDEAALAAFVRTYPIDFDLHNQDQHHVLYIDDNPAGQVMTLQLTNTSRQDLVLPDIGQNVSAQDYHFALGFRPQTVAQTPQPSLATEDEDWVFSRTPDNTSFYLLHKGEMQLPAGQSTDLTLLGMNADGRDGTRGTRVELLYQRLKYSGEEAELRGSRLQYLDVVNQRGLREIPLHAGFVGGNTVLSDGSTASTLRLRIANTSRDSKIRLNAGDATTPVSSFVVSFDVQEADETREWALVASANADGAQLTVSGGTWADPVKSNLGQSIEWTITPQENVELGPNDSLILTLDKVIALQSLGHANVYVNYRNIPGYQDGLFVVGVEKSPLLFWQKTITDTATIGVGLQQPTQTLDVNGNIRQRGFDFYLGLGDGGRGDTGYSRALVKDAGSRLTINYASDFKSGVNIRGPQISLDGNVAVGASETTAKVQIINQAQDANGNTLILGPIDAANLRLGYHTDYSWIQSHGAKPLKLNPIGNNVGIGTAEPADTLDVSGNLRILTGSNPVRFTAGWSGFPDTGDNHAEIANDTADYKALMIVGNKSGGQGRRVSVFDVLHVNGALNVTKTSISAGDATIEGNLGTRGWSPTPRTSGWGGGIHTWDIEAEGTAWVRHGVQTGERDLAENFASDMDLDPGDVVCMGDEEDSVVASEEPDDELVLGVVSSKPGLLLNSTRDDVEDDTQFPVALCGRVPCKVVDENGPIKRGDLLTTSSTPGHAMKAVSVTAGEQEIYRPGTIVGKALGSLESGTGVIEIFVTSR